MVELVLLSATGIIVLFAGITVLINTAFQVTGLFIFLTVLVGYVLLTLTYRKRRKLNYAKMVIYHGYENYLFFGSMIFMVLCCLGIYLNLVDISSLISPVIMICWLSPLVSFLYYESLLIFNEKDLIFNGEVIRYKDVKSIEIFDYKKNKKKLIIQTKEKELIYTGKNDAIEQTKKAFIRFCHRVKIK